MVEIERIESQEDAQSSPELDPAKADFLAVQELGFIGGANVLSVGGTAEDIRTVTRISDPARSSPVEDGITPGIDVDGEALPSRVDIRYPGDNAPVLVLVHIEFLQEDDHLWRGNEGASEVDAA